MNGSEGDAGSPLAGLTVVVTRAKGEDEPLARLLAADGAEVRALPMVAFVDPLDPQPVSESLDRWEDYDWVVFASPRGIEAVARAFGARGTSPRGMRPRRLAVVGPSTAAAAGTLGWAVDLMPERFDGEALLDAFDRSGETLSDRRILFVSSDIGRDVVPAGLRARGARVDDVRAYRTAVPDVDPVRASAALQGAGLLVFASPSAARNLAEASGGGALAIPAAAIGPVTAAAAESIGYRVVTIPPDATIEGLARAVRSWWSRR